VYILTVTNIAHPEFNDAVTVNVKPLVGTYTLKGTAILQSKEDPRADVARTGIWHLGTKVELIDKTTGFPVAATYTNGTGGFELKVPAAINIAGTGYLIRYSRIGNKGVDGTPIRNESYLCADLPINVANTISVDDVITIKNVILVSGALMTPGADKDEIVESDAQVARLFIGISKGINTGYEEAVDINEYNGNDAGDWNIVRMNIGKAKTLPVFAINN